MLLRPPLRGVIVPAALALLAACHGRSGSTSATANATVTWTACASAISVHAPAGATTRIDLPGAGSDFRFEPGASFVETLDGRGVLTGVLTREADRDDRFAVRVVLRRAPAGVLAPRAELDADAYAPSGGPVDVATWRYFRVVEGEMRGSGNFLGAHVTLAPVQDAGLQCGRGADNLSLEESASVVLLASGLPTASDVEIEIPFALRTSERTYAVATPGDAALGGVARPTLSIPALGGGFHVISGGSLVERADGTLRFDAVLADADATDRRFALSILARDRRDAAAGDALPPGAPFLELAESAYRPAGGPVDPDLWRGYGRVDGVLQGLGALSGAEITVHGGAFPLQVGPGASGVDGEHGASASLTLLVVAQPFSGPALPWGAADGVLRATLRSAYTATADEAVVDPAVATVGGYALSVPGLATDFVVATGGEFRERTDGRAELFAELVSASNPDEQWTLSLDLASEIGSSGGSGAPSEGPVLRLLDAAYVANGGTIDPARWHYYASTTGELRGLGPRAGARIALAGTTPTIQVGEGANGANLQFGLLGGLAAHVVEQPAAGPALGAPLGTAEILLTLERIGDRCIAAAPADAATSPIAGTSALAIADLFDDLVLLPGARLAERADGTAELRGVLARASAPAQRFLVALRFAHRIEAEDELPAGSPRLELLPAAYVSGGGSVDPATWHFYEASEGSLTGLANLQGLQLRVASTASALQVGSGASGRNARYGASAILRLEQVTPAAGAASSFDAVLRVNLFDACP